MKNSAPGNKMQSIAVGPLRSPETDFFLAKNARSAKKRKCSRNGDTSYQSKRELELAPSRRGAGFARVLQSWCSLRLSVSARVPLSLRPKAGLR